MDQALLDTTPIPADIIKHLIAPMASALNHRAKFDAVLTQLHSKQVRAKAYQAIQEARWGTGEGWFTMPSAKFQAHLNMSLGRQLTLQQCYATFIWRKLKLWSIRRIGGKPRGLMLHRIGGKPRGLML